MKKTLRLPRGSQIAIEQWSRDNYPLPVIPRYVYSKHLRRRAKYRYRNGTVVIDIGNGWYVHSFRNGIRMLSVLPF
ncbi:MAG: hypothetical protein GC171_15440 [Terrimonas sp.]|nr:hypothetical protein [Terrimonas sp.]